MTRADALFGRHLKSGHTWTGRKPTARFQQKAIYLKFVRPVKHLIVSEKEVHGDEG